MIIKPLSECMQFFRAVAELKFQEFSYLTGSETIEDYLHRQQKYVTNEVIPRAYVALNEAGDLLGTFALKVEDLSSRPDLSPWLGSVVVAPAYRRQGVGAAIVSYAEQLARGLGYSVLYLYTPDQESWYTKQDWQTLEQTVSGEYPVTVMAKTICEVDPV
jgi:N-acetylglutamate synthase-like GNAT family acetyltransferase